jgi:hypothetical protein
MLLTRLLGRVPTGLILSGRSESHWKYWHPHLTSSDITEEPVEESLETFLFLTVCRRPSEADLRWPSLREPVDLLRRFLLPA